MSTPAGSGRRDDKQLVLGRISGVYGLKGWVKIFSYCRPRENIFSYRPWLLKQGLAWQSRQLIAHRQQGRNLLALLENISDRDLAQEVIGLDIAVASDALPALAAGEYYWHELIDMEVFDSSGTCLGRVRGIQETGANDVLAVEGARACLIPLVQEEIVQDIDLENGRIIVDWNPEYI